jgi:hypothetical protein
MCQREIMEETNKNFFVSYKTADDIGVWKVLNGHGPVVDSYEGVDIQLIFFDLCFCSLDFSEVSKQPFSIIKIGKSILISN